MRQTMSFLVMTVLSLLLLGACGSEASLSFGALGVVRDVEFDDQKNPDTLYLILDTSGIEEDKVCNVLELTRLLPVDADGNHYYGHEGSMKDPSTGERPCAELKDSGDHLIVETMIPAKYRYIVGNTGIALPEEPLETTP
jgi:hypothetical protein